MKSVTYIEVDVPTFTVQSPEALQTYRFAIPTSYLPQDIEAIPSIDSVSFTPARISLGEDLGQRASLVVSMRDHLHVFAGESYNQGTFFGKWRGRYGAKLRGRALRLIRGQVGQSVAQMDTRHYVIERSNGPTVDGVYTIEAKDILKLADEDRAQAPALSNGRLAGSLTVISATAILNPSGIGDTEYPATGWVCIGGKEVVEFTRVSDTLTITRGQLGTLAQAHTSADRVQLVLRYPGTDVADIIYDLLVNYAGVPASYIALADWQAETAAYLGVIYATTVAQPTSVRELVATLVEQAALALWWDDRALQVRLAVLREIATDTATFDADIIVEGSLRVSEQPDKRISQIWTYYGKRDPTDTAGNEDNYRAALADVDLSRESEYGSPEIRKIQAGWIETLTAATRLNSLQISRFRDPPRLFEFDVPAGTAVTPAAGYQLSWWANQDESGVAIPASIQIVQVTIQPDRVHIMAEEMLASGVVVLQNVQFLTTTGSLLSFDRPATWNDANNTIETIAAGGGGRANGSGYGGKGGGGGGYSKKSNVTLAASSQYRVGAGGPGGTSAGISGTDGGDTWFGGATLAASQVGADGGTGATSGTTGGVGGLAASGVGDVKYSGGDGGTGAPQGETRAGGGGGGGAGGSHGNGAPGGNNSSVNQDGGSGGGGADGGFSGDPDPGGGGDGGDNRFSFGGGNATTPVGDEGGGGKGGSSDAVGYAGGNGEQLWTQTVTPIISAGPGGGGGGGGTNANAGNGGLYGGGGGGSHHAKAGDGKDGIIILTWTVA